MNAVWWVAVVIAVLCLIRAAWVGILLLAASWKSHTKRIDADTAFLRAIPKRDRDA